MRCFFITVQRNKIEQCRWFYYAQLIETCRPICIAYWPPCLPLDLKIIWHEVIRGQNMNLIFWSQQIHVLMSRREKHDGCRSYFFNVHRSTVIHKKLAYLRSSANLIPSTSSRDEQHAHLFREALAQLWGRTAGGPADPSPTHSIHTLCGRRRNVARGAGHGGHGPLDRKID